MEDLNIGISNLRIFKSGLKAYLELIRYPLFTIPIVSTLPGVVLAGNGEMSWKGYVAIIVSMIGYFGGMMKMTISIVRPMPL